MALARSHLLAEYQKTGTISIRLHIETSFTRSFNLKEDILKWLSNTPEHGTWTPHIRNVTVASYRWSIIPVVTVSTHFRRPHLFSQWLFGLWASLTLCFCLKINGLRNCAVIICLNVHRKKVRLLILWNALVIDNIMIISDYEMLNDINTDHDTVVITITNSIKAVCCASYTHNCHTTASRINISQHASLRH